MAAGMGRHLSSGRFSHGRAAPEDPDGLATKSFLAFGAAAYRVSISDDATVSTICRVCNNPMYRLKLNN